MNAFVDWAAYWLADFYLATTLLLAAALGVMAVCRQPANRLAVAKAAIVALALLAGLCVLPGWSLITLEWTAAEATVDVSNQPRAIEVAPAALAPVVDIAEWWKRRRLCYRACNRRLWRLFQVCHGWRCWWQCI